MVGSHLSSGQASRRTRLQADMPPAAHCVYEKEASNIQVLLRGHNTADSVIKLADVAEIINHPDWDRPTIDNDYAILRLAKPVTFNKKVAPACLPADTAATYAGVLATATGWGKLETESNKSPTLQEVDLTVTTQSDCIKAYGNWNITANMICAAASGKSTCTGDSGGPLIAPENGRYTVVRDLKKIGCHQFCKPPDRCCQLWLLPTLSGPLP